MEGNNIAEIHEMIYAHLIEKYDKLTFTLRVINRSNRLKQGYWFHGNENYLTFSFWDSWAESTMRPSIALEVFKLESNNFAVKFQFWYTYENEKICEFFDKISKILSLKEEKKDYLWSKSIGSGTSEDVLKTIDKFIQTDMIILDEFIENPKFEVSDYLKKISNEHFKNSKSNLERFRKKLNFKHDLISEKYQYKQVKLTSLYLKNISNFKEVNEIEFDKRLTCFIGLNGTGKTTILRAIVNSIISRESLNYLVEGRDIATTKLRNFLRMNLGDGDNIEFEKYGKIILKYDINKIEKNNQIEFIGKNKSYEVIDKESDFSLDYNEGYLNTLVLAFPQEKSQKKIVEENVLTSNNSLKENLPNITDIGAMITDEPDGRFIKVEKWLLNTYSEALNQSQEHKIELENTKQFKNIKIVFEILSAITSEEISLVKTNYERELVWLNINEEIKLMSLISDGYSNLFGWVGNLVLRLYEVITSTPYENLIEIPAIVLIDEIDTYLHPQWQSKILAILLETFPNIQFIVTTHSPYVVGSIHKDLMRLYICKNEGKNNIVEEFTDFKTFGANIEVLSDKIFNASIRGRFANGVSEKFEGLSVLINSGNLGKAKNYIETQFSDIDENDPELLRSKMLIRTKEILAK